MSDVPSMICGLSFGPEDSSSEFLEPQRAVQSLRLFRVSMRWRVTSPPYANLADPKG